MTEVAVPQMLVNVDTGEQLPATIENAAAVLNAARDMKKRMDDLIYATTLYLVSESTVRGTQTLNVGDVTVTLSGGEGTTYDAQDLMEALRVAGCPEDRIEQAVVATVSFKINRSVLRQLAAANPDYEAAIELAARTVEMPYRASVR